MLRRVRVRTVTMMLAAGAAATIAACGPPGGAGGGGGGPTGGGGGAPAAARAALPDGDYACAVTSGGTTYQAFLCRVTTAGGATRLVKLEGSQRVRGTVTFDAEDRVGFHGEVYCPGGGCTRPLETAFVRQGDGAWIGDIGGPAAGGDTLRLEARPDGMYAGAGYGGDAWADDGYGGAGYGGVGYGGVGDGGPSTPPAWVHITIDRALPGGRPMPDPATLALPPAPTDDNLRPPGPSATLVTVVQGHESLLAATPRSSTERPRLMALLAGDHRELFRASVAEGAATADPAERDRLAKVARAANGAEVNHLTNLLAQYPKWCQTVPADGRKPTGCADTWQYGLGRAHELGGRPDEARKVYLALIQAWPSSDSLPAAYFAFGEMFLAEAAADPSKLALAAQAYEQVAAAPPPANRLWGHARLRLARIAWRKGDYSRALSELKKTIEYGQTYASLPGAEAVAVAARADLVPVFALAGDPRRAHDFVRPLAGDAAASSARTFALLDDLRGYYRGAGRRTELVALDEDLVARDAAPRRCERLAELVLFTGFGLEDDKDVVRGTALRLIDLAFRLDTAGDPEAAACTPATISLVTALAMAWDAEATGYVGGAPGSGDRATQAVAAALYRAVVSGFTDAQVAAAPFSRQNAVDRRSRAELAARAALLDAN